jgi:alpha-glucosidase
MLRLIAIALCLVEFAGCQIQPSHNDIARGIAEVCSPDAHLLATLNIETAPTYAISLDNQPLLAPSKLGLSFHNMPTYGPGAKLISINRRSVNRSWENPIGKRREVRDHYNQLCVTLRRPDGVQFDIILRAYNDGIAIRYSLPRPPGAHGEALTLDRELTEFAFPLDARCWAGSQPNGFTGAQEWEFWPTHLGAISADHPTGLPLLVKTENAYVAITEADLTDYPGMWLTSSDQAPVAPAKDGHTAQAPPPNDSPLTDKPVTLYAHLAPRLDGRGLATISLPHATPWRVLMIARKPGELIESDLISNLAPPSAADFSWVRPGMMAWDHWWSGDVKMDTGTLKQYIQLAHDMGWPYQLIDWQWYGSFNKPGSDITHINPTVDMDEVRRFAKEKNVKLWVWLYWTDAEKGYEKAFPLYEAWGIAGVKIDFMDRDDQEMVNWYAKMTRAAAAHHLMINFHGAMKPTGMNRAWPNQITREGIMGNEYNRWSARVTPEHKLTLPFTRLLAGPADFTPGGFQNRQPSQFKADNRSAEVQGTRAAELALFVLYDSPIMCACDRPDHYANQPGSDFLKIVPTVWDDTKVLDGAVGEKLVEVRRSGDMWFLGALTNSSARDVTINTDFLGSGKWRVRIWKDAPDSAQNAEHLVRESRDITAGDAIALHLAPAGGAVARFEPR